MILDLRTMYIALGATCFIVSAALLTFQTRQFRRDGSLQWALGWALYGGFMVLIGLRGIIGDFLSIVIANTFLTASYSLLYAAVLQFRGRSRNAGVLFVPVAATFIFFWYYSAYVNNLPYRIIFISLLSILQISAIIVALLRNVPVREGLSYRLTGFAFFLMALVMVNRLLEAFTLPFGQLSILHATAFRNAGNIATLAAAVLSSIGFVLMIRQRAEEEVRRKEEDLREAQRITHIGSWYWDASTDATTGSDELLRIYGLDPPTEAMPAFKEQDGRLYPHDSWEKINAGVQETLETGVGYNLDVAAIRGGAKIWVTTRSEAVRDANGHIVGLRGTVQDITEAKQAEEEKERLFAELSTERARWEATVENMLDPVTVCDAEGRATYMNHAYQKLIERPIAENLGVEAHPDYYQLYRPDGTRFPAEELPLQKAAHTGEDVQDVELIQRSAGGREFTAIFSAAPLRDQAGRVTGAVAVGRDITEQRRVERVLKDTLDELESRVQERTAELQQAYDRLKAETEERQQIEAQLRQAQKMEALGTLSGGIAHDFNNILAAIVGFGELLQGHTAKGSKDAHRIQRIMEAAIRGRELVQANAHLLAERPSRRKRPLRLNSIVQEAMKLLRASIPSTISVRVRADGAEDLVFADPIQMQQVLMNLCTNAAHAMQEKGGILGCRAKRF